MEEMRVRALVNWYGRTSLWLVFSNKIPACKTSQFPHSNPWGVSYVIPN